MNNVLLDTFSGCSAWCYTQAGQSIIQQGRQKGFGVFALKLITDVGLAYSVVTEKTKSKDELSDLELSKKASDESFASIDSVVVEDSCLDHQTPMRNFGRSIDNFARSKFSEMNSPRIVKSENSFAELGDSSQRHFAINAIEEIPVIALPQTATIRNATPRTTKFTPQLKKVNAGLETPFQESVRNWQNNLRK